MIGKTILHYRIIEKLGQGGMGAVYKAEDTKLKRIVALKFLPPQVLADEADKARFVHEAQSAAALDHPNICTVYEINEADDQIFISMAYLPGGSLRERIERGPLGAEDTLKIAVEIARGLQAAHEKQIIHRDIKPTNIMFSESGAATVMDFGLAKSKHQTHVTKMGTTMGTVAYMSPEQTRGDSVDHRTDIWSLGVMLYEMTTGRRPFRGDYDEAVIYSILNEPPAPVDEVRKDADPNLAYIIHRAIAKSLSDRYQDCAEMLADLEAALDEIKIGSSKSRSATRTRIGPARRKTGIRRFATARVVFPTAIVVAAAVVGVVLMWGPRKGGVTETVAVVDEQGHTVQRAVPKSEFRRSFALYFFDNKTGDHSKDWLDTAIPMLLEMDLGQDPFLTIRSPFDPYAVDRLQRAGFKSWEDAPWSFKQRLASDSHTGYLVTGSFTIEKGDFVVTRDLHEAATGRLVSEKTYRGKDIFALVDDMSVAMKTDLNVPVVQAETIKDLPVAEITTKSVKALENIAVASKRAAIDQDWAGAIAGYEKAVAEDSTAAIAYLSLLQLYINANRGDKLDWTIQHLMHNLYRLPEREQFVGKQAYYILRKEPEKAFAVLRMAIDLYPEDITARQVLAIQLGARNRIDEAIKLYDEILAIDPDRTELLQTIGGLYRQKGDFAKALEYYESYAAKSPTNVNSFTEIAATYMITGDYDRAQQNYDKALLLEPQDASVLTALADIDERLGRWDEALSKYADALTLCKKSDDRVAIYASVQSLYMDRGQLDKAFEQMRLKWAEMEKSGVPVYLMITKLMDARQFVKADRTAEAFGIIEKMRSELGPPYDGMVPLGYVYAYLETGQADSAEVYLRRLQPFIDAYQIEQLRQNVHYAEGRIAEIRGDYAAAIAAFRQQAAINRTDAMIDYLIGRCQRKSGDMGGALASLEKTLKIYPTDADVLYELALVQSAKGEKEKAMESLKKALDVWKDADPVFKPARDARGTLASWTS
jgi:serine/threonine protein kinase/tetratricopeptide (TPR) repeat protein